MSFWIFRPPRRCGQSPLVGGIQAQQREKDGRWEENARLIAVADHSRTLAKIKFPDDLQPDTLKQLIAFFEQYNKL